MQKISPYIIGAIMLLFLSNILGASSQKNSEIFYAKFTPIKEEVLDEGGYFSFSEVTEELRALFPLAEKIGKNSQELFDLYDIYAMVLSKKESSSKETIEVTLKMLNLFKNSPLLSDKKALYLHYRLSNAYTYEDNYEKAIYHLEQFLKLTQGDPSLSQSAILGQREQLGYLYHENEQYQEALSINLETEKEARENGVLEEDFSNLYNNIAQNYYELHDFTQVKAYLNKRLANAQTCEDVDMELDTLFQLAVLAFEQDEFDTAKELFEKRVAVAKINKLDKYTLEHIQEDLDAFYDKLKKR